MKLSYIMTVKTPKYGSITTHFGLDGSTTELYCGDMTRARIVGIATIACAFLAPAFSHADSVQTAQVLPPGDNNCTALVVTKTDVHMQAGELQSFDVTISDSSYVSLLASVGESSVPFNFMSRWNDSGALRIHVDVPSTPIYGSVPVTMTLLSSPTGRPTCLSVLSFTIQGPAKPTEPTKQADVNPGMPVATAQQGSSATATSGTSTGTSVISPVFAAAFLDRLLGVCTAQNAFRLWFLLLAVYVIILVVLALAQEQVAIRSSSLPLAITLVPLVLLIAFWYFAPACRAANWIPLALIAAAVAGLLVMYREQRGATKVVNGEVPEVIRLPAAKKKVQKTSQ